MPMLAQKAGANPPAPESSRTPPRFPIDDHLPVLLAIGLILGAYFIYRQRIQSKATRSSR